MNGKTCSSCKRSLPLDDFHRRTKASDGRQTRCKDCNKAQRVEYYRSAHGKAKNDLTGKRYSLRQKFLLYEFLTNHPCVDCGEADPVVLEFDHRDLETKEYNISEIVGRFSTVRLMEEVEKCDVRCANCHKRRTASQFSWAKLYWNEQAPVA